VLAYFGLAPLPPELVEIPIEYFGAALRWLRQQPGVNPQALAVMGWSRGGELTLLLGATFPELRAIVAYVPSGVMWEGVQAAGPRHPEPRASWALAGKPLPFVRIAAEAIDWSHPPVVETPGFVAALRDEETVQLATIPVERTGGPILLISGQDDQLWPSAALAQIALRRLTQHDFAFPVEHLSYPSAGHLIGIPYTTTTVRHARHRVLGYDFSFGGTPAADAFAQADSWPKVLAFLTTAIGGQPGLSMQGT
jgi:dienelactone hydrolase